MANLIAKILMWFLKEEIEQIIKENGHTLMSDLLGQMIAEAKKQSERTNTTETMQQVS